METLPAIPLGIAALGLGGAGAPLVPAGTVTARAGAAVPPMPLALELRTSDSELQADRTQPEMSAMHRVTRARL